MQRIEGDVRIDYHNKSPHALAYVWIQLDQNRFRPDSDSTKTRSFPNLDSRVPFNTMKGVFTRMAFDGGYKIDSVTDGKNKPLPYTVVKTMMRVDLPEPLKPGTSTRIQIRYAYNIVNAKLMRARAGHEYFEKDKNHIYEIAQFYPRAVAYTDYTGWQHKQFLGRGEFTLELGDYRFRLTLPADMVVSATGQLQNADDRLEAGVAQTFAGSTRRKETCIHHHPQRGKGQPVEARGQNEDVGIPRQERSRFCFRRQPEIHLGRDGRFGQRSNRDGDVTVPE